jgi:hypothetical protein
MKKIVLCLSLVFAAVPVLGVMPGIGAAEAGPCDPNLQRC